MRPYGRGILPESQIYLYETPEQEKRMFLYPLCVGHYQCSDDYIVNRSNFDSFLLMYVKKGAGYYLGNDNRRVALGANSFALLDCYKPHVYGALEPLEMYFVHFDGPTARAMCERILQSGACVPRNLNRCRDTLVELCERTARSGALDGVVANRILVDILSELLLGGKDDAAQGSTVIDDIRSYILDNLDKDLTLESLSRRANLSTYHFARTFKRQVGVSPHDFLIDARINLAAFYLKSTDDPIKNIAYVCGFSNESTFCTTFKNRLGQTPSGFRLSQSG